MSALPSDDQLRLELHNLSFSLYESIDMEGELAPTYGEWDTHRDRRWSLSRDMLKVFGLTENRVGWTKLVNAYGFFCPTRSETKRASIERKKDNYQPPKYYTEDESYPELTGTSQYEEVYYVDLGFGNYRKVTRTVTSLR